MKKYMCDFETSTEEWLQNDNGKARVWAACCVSIELDPKVKFLNNNISDFMINLIKLGNIECYFHNLKFDGEYIINWLFENGYKYDKNADKPKTFKTTINDMGVWYGITITHKVYNKRYIRTNIYDSLKKLPFKVEVIAKTFDLPMLKGEIDYKKYRPIGYEPNDLEIEYIKNDCLIVAMALAIQFGNGLEKMTIGCDAMANFKHDLGSSRAFDYFFPKLPLEVDNDIRLSYKGGFTMANPNFTDKIVNGISFDVNSLYPSVMYGNMGVLPYGLPRYYKGKYQYDKDFPIYIQKLHCKFKIKPNHIPTIQIKNNLMFLSTEYITDSKDIVDLVLTSVDLELMLKHYDIDYIEYECGYKFRATDTLFKGYIDYWSDIKAKSTGGKRQLAKLMLNNLYGKFASNPKRVQKIPVKQRGGGFKLIYDKAEFVDPVYTALGAFITARARCFTITNSQTLYEHWVYSDTDSMYLTGITEEEASKLIEIHPTKLGAWKLEHHFTSGKWLRPKTYIMESIEDGLTIACAGMPDNVKNDILKLGKDEAFKAFTKGATFNGKLRPIRVNGGVVLTETTFTLNR